MPGQSCRITYSWGPQSWGRQFLLSWGELFRIQTSSQLPEVRNSFKNLQHMSKPQRPGQLTQDHPFYLSCDWEEFKQNYNKIIKTSFCSILITAVTYYFVVLGNYFNKTPSNCQRSQRMASLQWHLFFLLLPLCICGLLLSWNQNLLHTELQTLSPVLLHSHLSN